LPYFWWSGEWIRSGRKKRRHQSLKRLRRPALRKSCLPRFVTRSARV